MGRERLIDIERQDGAWIIQILFHTEATNERNRTQRTQVHWCVACPEDLLDGPHMRINGL
jgi:hypothetical protein